MKVAVIGCGTIANAAHIPAYLKNSKAEIKYFCDNNLQKAKAAVEKYGCGIAVADYREVLADPEVEAISVCTPNYCHSEISCAALKAGKNVLCEKPAARTLPEAEEMLKAQNEYGKVLNIGVCNRFNDNVREMKRIIDSGRLGEIYAVYVSFRAHRSIPGLGGAFTTKSIAGGGVLIDWGVHYLDIVMFCCGDPNVKTVSAETFSKLGSPIKDYVYKNMWAGPAKYDGIYDVEEGITGIVRTDGPSILINGAWAQNIAIPEQYIDFIGTKAGIRLTYGGSFEVFGTKDGDFTNEVIDVAKSNMYENEIDAFLDNTKDSNDLLPSHISVNIKTQRLMDALYRSAEEHKEIEL